MQRTHSNTLTLKLYNLKYYVFFVVNIIIYYSLFTSTCTCAYYKCIVD